MTRATAQIAKPLLLVLGIPLLICWKIFDALRKALVGRLDCKSKAVLITGCDTGIGHATAISLAGKGCTVFAGCFTEAGVEEFKAVDSAIPFRLDVTSDESVNEGREFVGRALQERRMGLWGLLNNAGIGDDFYFELTKDPVSACKRVADVNYFGQVRMVLAFLPLLKESNGRIINLTSVAGLAPFPGATAYAGSKHAAQGFTQSLRLELVNTNPKMSVSTINPGAIATPLTDVDIIQQKSRKKWDAAPADVKTFLGGDEWFKQSQENMKEVFQGAEPPSIVVDAVEDALFSTYPLATYLVGTIPRVVHPILRVLPTYSCLFDFLQKNEPLPPTKGRKGKK